MIVVDAIHGVEIFGFEVSGSNITVDVYGGIDEPISGSLFYTLDDEKRLKSQIEKLRKWMATNEPLSYVVIDDEMGSLMPTVTFLQKYANEDD